MYETIFSYIETLKRHLLLHAKKINPRYLYLAYTTWRKILFYTITVKIVKKLFLFCYKILNYVIYDDNKKTRKHEISMIYNFWNKVKIFYVTRQTIELKLFFFSLIILLYRKDKKNIIETVGKKSAFLTWLWFNSFLPRVIRYTWRIHSNAYFAKISSRDKLLLKIHWQWRW